MKKNILNIVLAGCALVVTTSCSDYLETSSPSTITENSATTSVAGCRSVIDGTYTNFHDVLVSHLFGNGMFYAGDMAGSDIERHGGERAANRIPYETFYFGGDADTRANYNSATEFKEAPDDAYAKLYAIISSTNAVINGVSEEQLAGDEGKEYRKLIDEAKVMRATCYRELIKYYGDVPARFINSSEEPSLSSRLDIYDQIIKDLQEATNSACLDQVTTINKDQFTLQYAYALLGRIALERAGYQTFRLDITDASRLEKHSDYTDVNDATYARATDYKTYYDIAYNAFEWVTKNMGGISFNENDYSEFFTQLHGKDRVYANESIFEDEQIQGASGNCERSYSLGRPSNGGSSKAYPCKSYAQCRINPAFYYGVFDPKDVRRDVSCVVTGSDGKGYEVIIPFDIATTAKGAGISCGKFDENRQQTVWTANQRRSGINNPYMRISEVYLGLAEAALMKSSPDQSTADTYYNLTHKRAGLGTKSGVTLEDVIDERGFEFAAEGDRRWTLIRTGLIGKKVKEIKELTAAMMEGLKSAKGYFEFPNGNQISQYIYTKKVDPKEAGLSSRLTPATPSSMLSAAYEPSSDLEAIQFPGWRGQKDWESISSFTNYKKDSKSNLAIRGLFKHLDSTPEGYTKVDWGATLVKDDNMESFYSDEIFSGWDYKSAPIYLLPFTRNDCIGGSVTNGYGFMKY